MALRGRKKLRLRRQSKEKERGMLVGFENFEGIDFQQQKQWQWVAQKEKRDCVDVCAFGGREKPRERESDHLYVTRRTGFAATAAALC